MSYMRFFITDNDEIDLSMVEKELQLIESEYSIENIEIEPYESGDLKHADSLYGYISINKSGDGVFDDDIEDIRDQLDDSEDENRAYVMSILENARAIVSVQVELEQRELDETMEKIDPLWELLGEEFEGLLQVDGEGYFENGELILV